MRGTPWPAESCSHDNRRMHIGQAIKKKREEQGATQEEVAFRAGTDASNLSRMERGLQKPSLDMLEALAKALGTPVSSLYEQLEHGQPRHQAKELAPAPYVKSLRQIQQQFLELTPENQSLATDFIKLLGKRQKRD